MGSPSVITVCAITEGKRFDLNDALCDRDGKTSDIVTARCCGIEGHILKNDVGIVCFLSIQDG